MARSTASARAIVGYLRELRPALTSPRAVRRDWIRDVGLIIEEARTGDPIALSRRAGLLGHNTMPVFREARRRMADLYPPPECAALHEAIGAWIDRHVAACDALIRAEEQRSLRPLREVQEHLAEGRSWAGRFNAEYVRIREEVRQQVGHMLGPRVGQRARGGVAGRIAQAAWWPFGRAKD